MPRRPRRKPTLEQRAEGIGAALWFTIPVGSNVWNVYLADPHDCPHLESAEGVTVARDSAIYIDDTLEDSRVVAVLGHEIVHTLFTNANAELMAAIFGCPEADVVAAEERLAAYLGPQLLDSLQRAGLLKLTRLPR